MFRETYAAELCPIHSYLVEGDLLFSYVATFRQSVQHIGITYEMACLGNVFTYPGARRKGYGRRVVEAASRHIRSGGSDIDALFGEVGLAGFHDTSGWEPTLGPYALVGIGPDQ